MRGAQRGAVSRLGAVSSLGAGLTLAAKLALAVFLSGVSLTVSSRAYAEAPARAEVRLTPGADGALGAWLVAGPISAQAARRFDPGSASPHAGAELSGARFRVLGHRGGAIDLRRALGGPGSFAALAGRLEVKAPGPGYLLVGLDGRYSVWLNRKQVYERPVDALRGRGFEPVPLELEAGSHELLIWAASDLPHFALSVRIVSQADGLPPAGLSWALPGATDADRARLASELLESSLTLRPGRAQLRLQFPYGYIEPKGPGDLAERGWIPEITLGAAGAARRLRVGALPSGAQGTRDFEVSLPRRAGEPVELALGLGGERRQLTARREPATEEALELAARVEAEAIRRGPDHAFIADTLSWHRRALQGVTGADERRARERLTAFTKRAQGGESPLAPGVQHLALRSRLDGQPQPLSLHLPRDYSGRSQSARYPLVVLLHGYGSTPERILRAFLGSASEHPVVDGVVIAPHAHGDSFFRDAGEQNTLDVIDWALSSLPVDPDRVSISGVSMGGTGTAHLALRYPERFSAASPLSGYHSYFVRRDTSGRPIRDWELEQMHHFSPASWAENGGALPMYVAHGTLDHPLENSRVLVDRARALKNPITDVWPEIGHNAWEKVWARAAMWPWLSGQRRKSAPLSSLRLVTSQLRYGKRHFVELLALAHGPALARFEARVQSGKLVITTDGVTSFRLLPPLPAGLTWPLGVEVDGAALELPERAVLERGAEGWRVTKEPEADDQGGEQVRKRPGAEGPIRDLFLQPTRIVYGTRRPQTARVTREIARGFLATRGRADLHYTISADTELSARDRSAHNLLLIGGADDNHTSRAFKEQLFSSREGAALTLRGERFEGDGVGAIYIQPHPEDPSKSVVVIDAATAQGYWLSAALPQLIPDFLVFDADMLPATGQQLLGHARVLAGGRFDEHWQLPRGARDPAVVNPTAIPKR
ncbi:MAG: prolyl oligopeptidase family serine peptidase [Polyangiaceae bacterium]|nr:prolyl oligopeptidase family serine peptidase [Polyangiaceae bacterium]MCW5790849.1 prolyl oligopeptidase family serine peptidase [Polyangiaceae bacterium]